MASRMNRLGGLRAVTAVSRRGGCPLATAAGWRRATLVPRRESCSCRLAPTSTARYAMPVGAHRAGAGCFLPSFNSLHIAAPGRPTALTTRGGSVRGVSARSTAPQRLTLPVDAEKIIQQVDELKAKLDRLLPPLKGSDIADGEGGEVVAADVQESAASEAVDALMLTLQCATAGTGEPRVREGLRQLSQPRGRASCRRGSACCWRRCAS
ncbi:uncharacterized protein LOC129600693 [Paramacrobiotus metropolitanus]|uniref:uncharacterized protein LOC129600693 n=1 Tax=Paramacrobiotus metropolitanus TaxID=2943436 RepID=UPI002445C7F8|nr:uncharacterized protein LOC129600693 [Paramacrobiotus metropolitanus]